MSRVEAHGRHLTAQCLSSLIAEAEQKELHQLEAREIQRDPERSREIQREQANDASQSISQPGTDGTSALSFPFVDLY